MRNNLTTEQRKKLSSKAGKAAHAQGKAHEWNSEEASIAGRKGGTIVSRDREHMKRIGAMGGRARAKREAEQNE